MNKLDHLKEFKEILDDYKLPVEAVNFLNKTKFVILVGPSSSGRNSIINQLLKFGDYHYVVSDTTRKPRKNNGILELNGREYWFRKETDMLADLKASKFLEAAIIHNQQVSGISLRELELASNQKKIAIDEIEVVGADNIHKVAPKAIFLFVVPPSFEEWMVRMNIRGELPQDETIRRLDSAVSEIAMALKRDYYYFIVNDTFVKTAQKVDYLAKSQKAFKESDSDARIIARQLLKDTKKYLKQFIK